MDAPELMLCGSCSSAAFSFSASAFSSAAFSFSSAAFSFSSTFSFSSAAFSFSSTFSSAAFSSAAFTVDDEGLLGDSAFSQPVPLACSVAAFAWRSAIPPPTLAAFAEVKFTCASVDAWLCATPAHSSSIKCSPSFFGDTPTTGSAASCCTPSSVSTAVATESVSSCFKAA